MSKWIVNTYTFSPIQGGYFVTQGNLNYTLISGNLTLNAGDTSKVTFVVPKSVADDLYPVRTLVEVKFGNGLNPERKFFGTVVKKTRVIPDGTYKFEAVGVLGSYQFLPNYDKYGNDATILGIISVESQRFRGSYQPGSQYYTPNPWEALYSGHNEIPSAFGQLSMNNINLRLTCNLDSLQKKSKNAYEFLKAITKESSFILPEDYVNPPYIFRWFEYGETAQFKMIAGDNDQSITYDTNLISCSLAEEPYYTRVMTYSNGNGTYNFSDQSANGYPCPFNYARIPLPNKTDGSAYTYTEVQNATREELKKYPQLIEATAFDRHIIDESVPWLDMSKRVYVFYAPDEYVKAEITQIVYDFADPTKDRVKLGKIVQTATDSIATANEQIASNIETEVTEKLQVYEPIVANGTEIPANTNLNTSTYVNVGLYYGADNATVATLSNCPTQYAFTMVVRNITKSYVDTQSRSWQYIVREITATNGDKYIQRAYAESTAGSWTFGSWWLVNQSLASEGDNTAGWLKAMVGRQSSVDFGHIYDGNKVHCRLDVVSGSLGSNSPFDGDGYVLTFMWDNSGGWDTQVFFPNGGGHPSFRKRGDGSWAKNAIQFVTTEVEKATYTNTSVKKGSLYARRQGNVVHINASGDATNIPAATMTTYVTLASSYAPSEAIRTSIVNKAGDNTATQFVEIGSDGKVKLYSSTAITSATNYAFNITYIVD